MSTFATHTEGQVANQITSLTPDKRRITKDINSIKNIDGLIMKFDIQKKRKTHMQFDITGLLLPVRTTPE
jgi:hypothetical protein